LGREGGIERVCFGRRVCLDRCPYLVIKAAVDAHVFERMDQLDPIRLVSAKLAFEVAEAERVEVFREPPFINVLQNLGDEVGLDRIDFLEWILAVSLAKDVFVEDRSEAVLDRERMSVT